MSIKTEQINLRISSELKSQLTRVAAEQGISMSDYIRQTLEDSIQGDTVKERITSIEEQLKTTSDLNISALLDAASLIGSIDTNLPIEKCYSISLQIATQAQLDPEQLLSLSRVEMETNYLTVQDKIKSELGLSDRAIAFISLMFTTFTGITYKEAIFAGKPLAIKTLERLRYQLSDLQI